MLKLFYITKEPEIAQIAQKYGVDRIFADMEYIGKDLRQKGLNTVKNHHTVEDVKNLRKVLNNSQLLVRVNPINENSKKDECPYSFLNAIKTLVMVRVTGLEPARQGKGS